MFLHDLLTIQGEDFLQEEQRPDLIFNTGFNALADRNGWGDNTWSDDELQRFVNSETESNTSSEGARVYRPSPPTPEQPEDFCYVPTSSDEEQEEQPEATERAAAHSPEVPLRAEGEAGSSELAEEDIARNWEPALAGLYRNSYHAHRRVGSNFVLWLHDEYPEVELRSSVPQPLSHWITFPRPVEVLDGYDSAPETRSLYYFGPEEGRGGTPGFHSPAYDPTP